MRLPEKCPSRGYWHLSFRPNIKIIITHSRSTSPLSARPTFTYRNTETKKDRPNAHLNAVVRCRFFTRLHRFFEAISLSTENGTRGSSFFNKKQFGVQSRFSTLLEIWFSVPGFVPVFGPRQIFDWSPKTLCISGRRANEMSNPNPEPAVWKCALACCVRLLQNFLLVVGAFAGRKTAKRTSLLMW